MAVTGGCNNCVKYLLFFFNFIFLCVGIAIVAVGLWLRFDHQNDIYVQQIRAADTTVEIYYIGTYITMATGCVVMAVGFLGCCGAMQESVCMLVFYFIALLSIFGLEIAGCTWCYANREQVGEKISVEFSKIIKDRYKQNDIAAQRAVDFVQEKFKCCGIDGHMDWFESGQEIPDSCNCNTTEGKSVCSERGFYTNVRFHR
ncbi:CD9 antigen-like [Anneissia japonica]|uniref:CD9 antigen-like n=1 Tax=Anneissia japonica TaxID=1529436 RepID=UPI0014259005|nr:CD9 antigen-like [Anneissia japonica]